MNAEALRYPDADLRVHPPRPPRAMLAGLVFVPRTIDKARAKLQGTLGLYKISPGISAYLLEWLGISEDDFVAAVGAATSDEDVAAFILARSDPSTFASINERLTQRGIRDQAHFDEVLPRYPILAERPQLRNWFEIFEADDIWTFDPANADKVAAAAN